MENLNALLVRIENLVDNRTTIRRPVAPAGFVLREGVDDQARLTVTRTGWLAQIFVEEVDGEREGWLKGKGATPEEATEELLEEIRAL